LAYLLVIIYLWL